MKTFLFSLSSNWLSIQVYWSTEIEKPDVLSRSYKNVGRPTKPFEECGHTQRHEKAVALKNAAKSSQLLLYSSKLAMDDSGDKAASKVLNELYTNPNGNSAEMLLSNSKSKPGSTHIGFILLSSLIYFNSCRLD